MLTQAEKAKAFRALHERDTAFIIPNPWDVGTARPLAHLGFEALATTSAGYAFSVGQRDNTIDRHEMMAHAAEIVSATDLPISADLENGFGDTPDIVAETVRLAAAARRPGHPIYEHAHAVERIRAASETARALPFAFTLTARVKITWPPSLTSATRLNGCRPIKRRVRMFFMRRVSPVRKISL